MNLEAKLGLALVFSCGWTAAGAQSSGPPCDKGDKGDEVTFRTCLTINHPPDSPAAPLERLLEAEGFVRARGDPPSRAYYRWIDKPWPGSLANYRVAAILHVDSDDGILGIEVN